MQKALELDQSDNLATFSALLWSHSIPHRISEESGKQVVWVGPDDHVVEVGRLFNAWLKGSAEADVQQPQRAQLFSFNWLWAVPWGRFPATLGLLVLCLLVALITKLGSDLVQVAHFTLVDYRVQGDYIYFATLDRTLALHQYWRFLTPIFIHFGWMHLVFNGLMLYVFGSRIEQRQGVFYLLAMVVVLGVASNYGQYVYSDKAQIFGGFSGVLYGFIGYCMVRGWMSDGFMNDIPATIYLVMVGWLLLGYTHLLDNLLGPMANAAHLWGLIAGMVAGVLSGLLFRLRKG